MILRSTMHPFPLAMTNRFIILVVNLLAWILSVVTLASCDFLVSEGAVVYDGNGGLYSTAEFAVGLFGAENANGSCESYPDGADLPDSLSVSRAFGVITNLLLAFAFICGILMIFLLKDKAARVVWLVARIMYIIALLSVIATFAISFDCVIDASEAGVSSSDVCGTGAAGACNGVNVPVVLALIILSWTTGPVQTTSETIFKPTSTSAGTPGSAMGGGPVISRTIKNTPKGPVTIVKKEYPNGAVVVEETFEVADSSDNV